MEEFGKIVAWIGAITAAALSWVHWHSVGWAILHFCCGWLYVLWYYLVYNVLAH